MKILYLYSDLMNLYGDYGNMKVLKSHLEKLNVECEIEKKGIQDELDLNRYDMIYIGSGTESAQKLVLPHLKKYRNDLKIFIEEEKPVLLTGNAMELLGKKISEDEALGIIDMSVQETKDRYTGDAVMKSAQFGEVVGFINKCTLIQMDEADALFTYEFKDSNLKDNSYEGYRYKNLFGTHLIGPVLVKNPNFMKEIICTLLRNEEGFEYTDTASEFEKDSYQVTLEALKKRAQSK